VFESTHISTATSIVLLVVLAVAIFLVLRVADCVFIVAAAVVGCLCFACLLFEGVRVVILDPIYLLLLGEVVGDCPVCRRFAGARIRADGAAE